MANKKNSRTRIVLPMNPRKTTTEVLDRADQQQGTKKTMVSTRRGVEVVTVNKQEMEALRKAAKEDAKKKRELEKMAQEQKRLQLELEKMQSALEAAKEREKNATMAIIPTNRKIKKENLNDDLVQHTMAAAKTFLFRQTKFVEDIFQERELAEDIIPHLAVDLPISKEEFIDDYSGIVYNGIKAACTDVQSNAKKRAQGLCFEQVNIIVFELPMFPCKNLHRFFFRHFARIIRNYGCLANSSNSFRNSFGIC